MNSMEFHGIHGLHGIRKKRTTFDCHVKLLLSMGAHVRHVQASLGTSPVHIQTNPSHLSWSPQGALFITWAPWSSKAIQAMRERCASDARSWCRSGEAFSETHPAGTEEDTLFGSYGVDASGRTHEFHGFHAFHGFHGIH